MPVDKPPTVIVERQFEQAADLDALQAIEDAATGCLDMHRVTFIKTYFSIDKKRMICQYNAPDAESVRQAQRAAQMPFTHVWACQILAPH